MAAALLRVEVEVLEKERSFKKRNFRTEFESSPYGSSHVVIVVYFRNSRVALLSSTMVRSFHIPLVLFPKFSMDTSAFHSMEFDLAATADFLAETIRMFRSFEGRTFPADPAPCGRNNGIKARDNADRKWAKPSVT